MNERIKELAEQAEDYAYRVAASGDDCQEAYTQKFAELIVRECIDIVGEYSEDGAYCQRQMIKERFGVE